MKINRNNKTVLLFSCRWWPVFQTEGCFPGNWERMPARPSSGWSGEPTVTVLAQLLLPKDEGSKTLDETAFFQQLLKPDLVKTVLLSRLRYLWSTDWRSCLEASHFQNFHLFRLHGHGGCQQRCQQVEDESDPGDVNWTKWWIRTWWTWVWNQLQISTGGWHCGSLQIQCRRFLFQQSTTIISEEEAIVNFLEKAAVKMELLCTGGHALKITLKSPPLLCLPRICNLHLHHCLQGCSFFVESHRNLSGRYQALRCYLQWNHLYTVSTDSKSQPCRPVCSWMIKVILLYHVFFSIHVLFLLWKVKILQTLRLTLKISANAAANVLHT